MLKILKKTLSSLLYLSLHKGLIFHFISFFFKNIFFSVCEVHAILHFGKKSNLTTFSLSPIETICFVLKTFPTNPKDLRFMFNLEFLGSVFKVINIKGSSRELPSSSICYSGFLIEIHYRLLTKHGVQ